MIDKHPRELFIIIFTGFWERFSFYGTLTVLLLYLTNLFQFSTANAYALWGAFIAFGFVTPILGGLFADYFLGFENTLIAGSTLVIIGYICLGFENHLALYLGLALSLCGSGLFKGSIASMVGMLYLPGDMKRHDAYSHYFVGMSLAAIFGPLGFGLIIKYINWPAVFVISAMGNLIGLLLFIIYRKRFQYKDLPTTPKLLHLKLLPGISIQTVIIFSMVLLILIMAFLFAKPTLGNNFMGVVSFAGILSVSLIAVKSPKADANKIYGLMVLNLLLALYYAAIFQINGSLIVGIEKELPIYLYNWKIPAPTFASLQALFAVILTPFLARMWQASPRQFFQPTLLFKIGFGLFFTAIGFSLFAVMFFTKTMPLLWITLGNIFLGISTACVLPNHMSAVSHYTPKKWQGTLMGVSYLSDALGGFIGSHLVFLSVIFGELIANTSIYTNIFFGIAIVMFCLSIAWIAITPLLRNLLKN